MKSGMKFRQGDILIVPFPFSDLSSVRRRPVLVLSKIKDNLVVDDLITCGITSNLKDSRHSVMIDSSSLAEGKIPVKSRVKIDKLFTLDKGIIVKRIGRVDEEVFGRIKNIFVDLV